nr:MAG TPA: hypothetical protein [Caudoviricetes sp.]
MGWSCIKIFCYLIQICKGRIAFLFFVIRDVWKDCS